MASSSCTDLSNLRYTIRIYDFLRYIFWHLLESEGNPEPGIKNANVFSRSWYVIQNSTRRFHRLGWSFIDWATTLVDECGDTCQLTVSFTYYSSGLIYETLAESMESPTQKYVQSFKLVDSRTSREHFPTPSWAWKRPRGCYSEFRHIYLYICGACEQISFPQPF